MNITFEPFNYPEELKKQRELFIECFPENCGTPVESVSHYNWKFRSFPSEKRSYEYVAKLNDEMIGYYAAIPYPYLIKGKKVNAAMVCDVMTGIKARGKGVFTKLGLYSTNKFKEEGFAFSTGYAIRSEVIPGHRKAGWSFPFQIPMYGKFIKMNSFLRTRNKSFLVPFANLALNICNVFLSVFIFRSKKILSETYSSHQLENIDGFSKFLDSWKSENIIALDKSTDFLKWRLNAPEKEYKILLLKIKKRIIGYSIFRTVIKKEVPCIGVLDFCLLEEFKYASGLMVRQIENEAKTMGAELILMMMMKHQAKKYKVNRNGFFKTPFPFSFIIKQFDENTDSKILNNEKNWNLMWIDSDDL
jgi:hypothetical protein